MSFSHAYLNIGCQSSDDRFAKFSLPYVDLCFGVQGEKLPFDHGYYLYSALSHFQALLHSLENVSIRSINGIVGQKGELILTERSCLRIRLSAEAVPLLYPLSGKQVLVNDCKIRFGIPQIRFLTPAPRLRSHLVLIRGYQEPQACLAAAQRQLEQLGIQEKLRLLINQDGSPMRRTFRIKQFTIIGFGFEVRNLSDTDSLLLQISGLGGKQKMGCGIFVPLARRHWKH